mmetsp:Transcript_28765/g.56504  ORF Transcript_28765/g.56504 Transcript_28765/m.56504 type:complete len:161 (-) Transcript_28765:268-750(-)
MKVLVLTLLCLSTVTAGGFGFFQNYQKKCDDCTSQACADSLMRCPVLRNNLLAGQNACDVISSVEAKKTAKMGMFSRYGSGNRMGSGHSSTMHTAHSMSSAAYSGYNRNLNYYGGNHNHFGQMPSYMPQSYSYGSQSGWGGWNGFSAPTRVNRNWGSYWG